MSLARICLLLSALVTSLRRMSPGLQQFQRSRARSCGLPLASTPNEAPTSDRWTSTARPAFLYVMYAMILWALPIGLVAAINPATAQAIAKAMTDYLTALPEPFYTLLGTGYLGYATLRQWGKIKGTDR